MAEWLAEHAWVAWMVLAALLAMSEMLTLDFTLLMLATGALAGGLVALAPKPPKSLSPLQLISSLIESVQMLVVESTTSLIGLACCAANAGVALRQRRSVSRQVVPVAASEAWSPQQCRC